MIPTTAPLTPPRRDPTATTAIERADRDAPPAHGMASIAECIIARHGDVKSGNEALLRLLMAAKRVVG